jgi:glycosyltransferase involved in cell wall biosynthesis
MNICMVTYTIYERDSRVRRYAECLAQDGHRVDVICLAQDSGPTQREIKNVFIHPIQRTKHRREGLGQVVEWLICALLMGLRLTGLDRRRRFDLIHIHNMPDFLVFCAIVPKLRGCPVILNIHDPSPEIAMSKLGISHAHPLARALVLVEKLSVGFSSHVLTPTESFRKILISRRVKPQRISVVTNSAFPGVFKAPAIIPAPTNSGPYFTLLFVGTVAARYGLDVIIRALPLIREEISNVRLRIVPKTLDEGESLPRAVRLAKELGVADLIILDQPAALERMPEIMTGADIGVYPAYSDCHMDIALSLKIPEMASVGLCIAGTRLPVLEELYGDDAIAFVPSGDHLALASKIVDLHGSPEMRRRLAANALARTKRFAWEDQYAAYLSLVNELVARRPK